MIYKPLEPRGFDQFLAKVFPFIVIKYEENIDGNIVVATTKLEEEGKGFEGAFSN